MFYFADSTLFQYLYIELLDADKQRIKSMQVPEDARYRFSVQSDRTYYIRYATDLSGDYWITGPVEYKLVNINKNYDALDFQIGRLPYYIPTPAVTITGTPTVPPPPPPAPTPPPPTTGSAHVTFSPAMLEFKASVRSRIIGSKSFVIHNQGAQGTTWNIASNQSWCRPTTYGGYIDPGRKKEIRISVKRLSNSGTYSCTLTLGTPGADLKNQTLPVKYIVSP